MSEAARASCRARSYHVPTCLVPTCIDVWYPPGRREPQATGRGREAPSARESSAGAFEQELREQPDSNRRRPFRMAGAFPFEVRGAGDIEMHPREAVHELAQEPRARDRSGGASPGILDVGHVGLEQLAIVFPQRQRPAALPGALARVTHLGEQGLVIA